ncbi:hypothetical protein Tco_0760410 [Tanacetum coccineum]
MKPKEPTYQVALDALALTTCYPAFFITSEVPVIYMHQFWATVIKHKSSDQFKIDKKRFFVNVEVFREILNICPKVPGKAFDEPPTEEEHQGILLPIQSGTSDPCPSDLSKPLPLKVRPGHLTVASEYFFNNDLEYLKSTDSERKYTTSFTKMKTSRYELVGIDDMIPKQWSLSKFSKHDVYSPLKILSVFKEGDFVNLHLNDIEDMLLIVVQHNLFHLDGEVIVDLAVALLLLELPVDILGTNLSVSMGTKSFTLFIVVSNNSLISSKWER